MDKHIKTLQLRVKDKHAKQLTQWAFEVNQVWNAANALSAEFSWIPIAGLVLLMVALVNMICRKSLRQFAMSVI